jgi:hypothetical protein
MKPSIKLALAALILFTGLSVNAYGQKNQPAQDQDAAPAITPGPYHTLIPCDIEKAAAKTTCKPKNPCTPACKEATKALKQCREQYHLPEPPPKIGEKKIVCSPGNVNSHPIDTDSGTVIEDQGYMNGNRNGVINNNTVQPGQ